MSLSSKLRQARGTEQISNVKASLPPVTTPQKPVNVPTSVESDKAIPNYGLISKQQERLSAASQGVTLPSGRVTKSYGGFTVSSAEKAKEIKDKYGIDVKRTYSPIQMTNVLQSSGLKGDEKEKFRKDYEQYIQLSESEKPLSSGVQAGLNVLPTAFEAKGGERFKETSESLPYKVGQGIGELTKYGALYGALGSAVAGEGLVTGAGGLANIGTQAAAGGIGGATGTLAPSLAQKIAFTAGSGALGAASTELAKDLVIGGTTGAIESLASGKDIKKTVAENFAYDVAFNVLLGAGGKVISKVADLRKAKTAKAIQEVADALKVTPVEAEKVIDDAVDFYVNKSGVASDQPFEQLLLPAPKTQGVEYKSDTLSSMLRSKPKADLYVNQFGVADTKPFEQLQIEAPKGVEMRSDATGINLRQPVNKVIEPEIKTEIKTQQPEKIYYRGTNPGYTGNRISTGNETWDNNLFASTSPEKAKLYGNVLEQIKLNDGAKVIVEGDKEFNKLFGKPKKNQLMLEYYSNGIAKAKDQGIDVVEFKNQSDVGTVIINKNAVVRNYESQQQIELATPQADFKGDLSLTQRKTADLADRKVKAFQFDNPEVQPFYREKAKELIDDVKFTKRGGRTDGIIAKDEFGDTVGRYGDFRSTSQTVAKIRDITGLTYDKITEALENIVKDKGAENNANAKRIESILDEMLVNGYRNFAGDDVPPSVGYIALRNRLDETKIPLPGEKTQQASQLNQQMQMGIDNQQSMFDARTDFDDFLDYQMPKQATPKVQPMPQIDRPSELSIQKPQYPPLAKDFAKETITPKQLPTLPKAKTHLQDITIQKPTYPEMQPKFAKETPKTVIAPPKPPEVVRTVETPVETPSRTPVFDRSGELPPPQVQTPVTGTSPGKFESTARKSAQTTEQLKERIKEVERATTSNEARFREAEKLIDEDFEGALNLVRSGEKFTSDMEGAMGNILYGKLQEQGRFDEALDIIDAISRKGRKSGQEVQILSAWAKSTPEGIAYWANKTLKEAGVKVDADLIAKVSDDVKKAQTMTPEQLAEELSKRIKNKQESQFVDGFLKSQGSDYLRELNVALSMKKITDVLPIATARKLSTIQSMAHLLNLKTFNRNILGNTASIALEQLSKIPASAADSAISLFTGNRTLVAKSPKWKQAMSEAFKEGKRSASEIFLGVNRATQDKYDLFFESAFKDKGLGKVGRAGEKLLSLSLNAPDEFFKGFVKADSIYNQVRARIGKEVDNLDFGELLNKATPEEIARAVDEAKYATFQNDSLPAKMLTDLKKVLNKVGIGKTSKSGMKEFGLGDLVIKYTRVPGNLIARGVEYSPLGYGKLFSYLGQPMTPAVQRQVAQVIGRATTGLGLASTGYLLGKAGLIQPIDDLTYDEAALARSEGKGNYKINVSGLQRLVTGGDPTLKPGDTLKSYDWIQPLNIPVAVGAQIANMDGKEVDKEQILRAFTSATMEQALDLPTMFIIQSMINEARNEENDFFDVATVPLKQALPGFVPAPVRQFAQFVDPVVRDTKGKNSAETAKKQIIANLPFLSKTLEPKLTPLGEEQVREAGLFGALVSPATTTTYNPAEFSDGLAKVKEMTDKTNFFPDRQPPKKFEYKSQGKKVELEMTDKERTLYQQTYGQYVADKFKRILVPASYSSQRRAEETAKLLSEAETEAREKAKNAVLKGRGLR